MNLFEDHVKPIKGLHFLMNKVVLNYEKNLNLEVVCWVWYPIILSLLGSWYPLYSPPATSKWCSISSLSLFSLIGTYSLSFSFLLFFFLSLF